jgi:RimJ/RimL family protein N-acetyltransferase
VVTPDNAASIRLLKKLGFNSEGTATNPSDGAELDLYASSAQ